VPPAPAEASLRTTRFSPREVIGSAASLWWAHAVPISAVSIVFSVPQALHYAWQTESGPDQGGRWVSQLLMPAVLFLGSRMRAGATTAGALEAAGGRLLDVPTLLLTGVRQFVRMCRVGLRAYGLAFLVAGAASMAVGVMRLSAGSPQASGLLATAIVWWSWLPFAAPAVAADAIALVRPGASPEEAVAESRALARGRRSRLVLALAVAFPPYAVASLGYLAATTLDPELGALVSLASAGVNAVGVGFLNVLCVVAYRALEREEKGVGSGELAAVFD